MGPVGPMWAPCGPHKPCYQGWRPSIIDRNTSRRVTHVFCEISFATFIAWTNVISNGQRNIKKFHGSSSVKRTWLSVANPVLSLGTLDGPQSGSAGFLSRIAPVTCLLFVAVSWDERTGRIQLVGSRAARADQYTAGNITWSHRLYLIMQNNLKNVFEKIW